VRQKFGALLAKLRLRHSKQRESDVAVNVLEPWLVPVPRTDRIEPVIALAKVAKQNSRGRIGDFHCLRHHVRAIAVARYVQCDGLPVFIQGRHCQSESHNDKIDRLNFRRQRRNPAALAAGLIPDPARAAAREAFRLMHRCDRVVGE